jgi:hypothetical protein
VIGPESKIEPYRSWHRIEPSKLQARERLLFHLENSIVSDSRLLRWKQIARRSSLLFHRMSEPIQSFGLSHSAPDRFHQIRRTLSLVRRNSLPRSLRWDMDGSTLILLPGRFADLSASKQAMSETLTNSPEFGGMRLTLFTIPGSSSPHEIDVDSGN